MRQHGTVIWIVLLFCAACVQEHDYLLDYPQIQSSTITSVAPTGVTIEGTLGPSVFDEIIDYGVVWSTKQSLSFDKSLKLSLGKPTSNSFTADIRSDLLPAKTYYFRVYARTSTKTMYGKLLDAVSQGSEGPVIESFAPLIVVPNDILTITGKNFGTNSSTLKVGLQGNGYTYMAPIKSLTDTEIKVEVPAFFEPSVKIVITKPENSPVTSKASVLRNLPMILSVKSTDLCASFEIIGVDFLSLGMPSGVTINNTSVTPTPVITNTSITIPASMHAKTLNVTVSYGTTPYKATKTLEDPVKLPTFVSMSGLNNERVIFFKGMDFPLCGDFSVMPSTNESGLSLHVDEITSTQIKVRIVSGGCYAFKVAFKYGAEIIHISDVVVPPSFDVTSISSDFGTFGSTIEIQGSGLGGSIVTLGSAPPFSSEVEPMYLGLTGDDIRLNATVGQPTDIHNLYKDFDGKMRLVIGKCGVEKIFPFDLQVPEPVFDDYDPKAYDGETASTGMVVTITGQNLINTGRVFLKSESLEHGETCDLNVISTTDTEILVFFPRLGTYPVSPGTYTINIEWFGQTYTLPGTIDIY